jgi:DNA-binding HxlR family transcriptional regulator
VIVKLMLIEGKSTFTDFIASDEGIASNILSAKLRWLEDVGMIHKWQSAENKKTHHYLLSESGLALTALIVELAAWSDLYLRDLHPALANGEEMARIRHNKVAFANYLQQRYREKRIHLTDN